jgi:hypothetical protein
MVKAQDTVGVDTLVLDGVRTAAEEGIAGVAQLARASAFQAEGRGFESRLPLDVW